MMTLLAAVALMSPPAAAASAAPDPAAAPPSAVVETLHGTAVADPYRWLEDAKSPAVQAFMTAQDAAARDALARIPFRDALQARLKALLGAESIHVPTVQAGRLFHERRPAGGEKTILYWRSPSEKTDHLLIDPATLSADGTAAMGLWAPSWDGKLMGYGIQPNAADEQTLRVRDVETGRDLPDVIPNARWSGLSWDKANRGFFYTFTPPAGPQLVEADRNGQAVIKYHKLGDDPARDVVFRGASGDASLFVGASVTADGRYLLAHVSRGWTSTEIFFHDLSAANGMTGPGKWQPLLVGRDANFSPDYHGGLFYVRTDDHAPRGRVVVVDPKDPTPEKWWVLVAEDPNATLESAFLVGGRLIVQWTRKAQNEAEIRDLNGKKLRALPLPPSAALEGFGGEDDAPDLYFGYSTLTSPRVVMQGRVDTGKFHEWGRVALPLKTAQLKTEQVFFPSKDGTSISMFLVYPKTLKRDGSTPFYLTGYGGFDIALLPYFNATLIPWLEAGGGLAIPNLRGGSEYGEAWHKAGMRDKKQNVFDDFIGAAEHLVHAKLTTPERLVISGASNGGLLMGAVLTQRPDLFRAVSCGVPLLDMIRYHRFGAGMAWVDEYGSADDPETFKWLYAYSPYHHVQAGTKYPTTIFMSADADDRVDPMHARKMAAALQAATTGGPVRLRIERNSGHGGADKVSAQVSQSADELAFLMDAVGLRFEPGK